MAIFSPKKYVLLGNYSNYYCPKKNWVGTLPHHWRLGSYSAWQLCSFPVTGGMSSKLLLHITDNIKV